jgi:hypothetical protein
MEERNMIHTTFNKCHDAGACTEGYRKLAKHLGGVKKYGKDTPIPLSVIIESNGLADALWTLRCTVEPLKEIENILIEFACQCAEHVLHFYEDEYPDDKRPRLAIEAARYCITDKSPAAYEAGKEAGRDAWEAAWATGDVATTAAWAAWAAGDATWEASWSAWVAGDAWEASWATWAARAARAAAWDADEIEWQTEVFLKLLNNNI